MNRRDVEGVAEWISTRRITVWNGAPAQLYDLAGRPDLDLSSLQEVWSGGSDTSDALRKAFADARSGGKRTVLLRVKSGENTRFLAVQLGRG